ASEENGEWLALVMGLLMTLADENNWVQFEGALDTATAAQAWQDMIDQAYADAEGGCGTDLVAPPYWADVGDSDDEVEPAEQIWYGEWVSGEFHEVLENWAIAGFLAYSGAPAAAVAFLTIAPKFRLAWKTGDLGGIIRIFVDAADMGTVNTHS